LQRVLFGEVTKQENAKLKDMDAREVFALVPLVVMAIVMGVAPMTFLRASEKTVNAIKQTVVGKSEKVAIKRPGE
jgi:NADH-quinone oxidoreductase subunit M